MSIDSRDFRPLDPGRINLMDPTEVQYWCAELYCTPVELENAVAQAGEHIAAVRDRLRRARDAGKLHESFPERR